jgi:hypothetical protein
MSCKLADKLFLLTGKKLLFIPAAWILCVILHNAIYGLFRSFFEPGGDEPFFFLLAVLVIPLYTIACLLYSLVRLGVKQQWRQSGRQ